MGPAWLILRADLRRRWQSWLALVLLAGLDRGPDPGRDSAAE